MPIVGNLSEFPLPEVLLLIGVRTGRLRLLDVPEFGILDIDFSEGEAQAMHMGAKTFTEAGEMIEKLSAVVQAEGGIFEFRHFPVIPVARPRPLLINQLVMSLVCYVDEQMAREKALTSPHYWYVLEVTQPDIWIEPDLNAFFIRARSFLATGVHLNNLAERLKLDVSVVHQNLTNLRLLGQIKMVDGAETVPLAQIEVEEKVARKSNEFLRASRVASEIKKITGKLPPMKL